VLKSFFVKEHNWLLKILLEDLHQYEQALKYIETLPFEEAQINLQKYGKILVTELPQPTTKLLMELCTSYTPKRPPPPPPPPAADLSKGIFFVFL
jgi:hypothetical protein